MARWDLRHWCRAAGLLAVFLGTPCVAAADSDSDRILATVVTLPDVQLHYSVLEVSEDRRTLYFASARRTAKLPPDNAIHRAPDNWQIGDVRLVVADLTDRRHPHVTSKIPVGDFTPEWAIARAGRLFLLSTVDNSGKPNELITIDVRDPRSPRLVGRLTLDFQGYGLAATQDGRRIAMHMRGEGERQAIFDVSDPTHPRRFQQAENLDFDGPKIAAFNYPLRLLDHYRDRALTVAAGILSIWDISKPGAPRLVQSIRAGLAARHGRLLPQQRAVVVETVDRLALISTNDVPVGAAALRRVHAALLADQAAHRHAMYAESGATGYVARLEDAGVRALIDGEMPGLAHDDRVLILNDYGYWLNQAFKMEEAMAVLRKVVELAPQRSVAWLNLAEAARKEIPESLTYEQKRGLSRTAAEAYASYRKLNGKDAGGAADFVEFNIDNAPADDVCRYVASFYNRHREDEIFPRSYETKYGGSKEGGDAPIDIANDGRHAHFEIAIEGTGDFFAIRDKDETINFFPPARLDIKISDIHVVPFKGKFYALYEVDNGPYSLVQGNVGVVCNFDRRFTPRLTKNLDPALCARAVAGEPFPEIETSELEQGEIEPQSMDLVATDSAKFNRAATVDIEGSGHADRIGYFSIESMAGPGCSVKGVAFLKGNALEDSARNGALLEEQRKLVNCRRSRAIVVSAAGRLLVQVEGGTEFDRPQPPRTWLQVKGGKVDAVCSIEQQPEYLPVAPN